MTTTLALILTLVVVSIFLIYSVLSNNNNRKKLEISKNEATKLSIDNVILQSKVTTVGLNLDHLMTDYKKLSDMCVEYQEIIKKYVDNVQSKRFEKDEDFEYDEKPVDVNKIDIDKPKKLNDILDELKHKCNGDKTKLSQDKLDFLIEYSSCIKKK